MPIMKGCNGHDIGHRQKQQEDVKAQKPLLESEHDAAEQKEKDGEIGQKPVFLVEEKAEQRAS